MNQSPEVVLLGLCVIDHLIQVSALPEAEGTAVALQEQEQGGGMSANVAVALSRLGRRAGIVTTLGNDGYAERMLADLQSEGVDTAHVFRRPDQPSTHVLLLFDTEFRRSGIFFHPETLFSLQPDELEPAYITKANVFFTDLEPPGAALYGARCMQAAGGNVVVDIQVGLSQSEVLGIDHDAVREAVSLSDLLLPSHEGLLELTARSTVNDALDVLCERYPGLIVAVTLSEAGSILARGRERIKIPAYPVDAVDTTGAGDIYHAALIEGLYFRDWPLKRAGHFASAAAALGCTSVGARTAAPTFGEVECLLQTANIQ